MKAQAIITINNCRIDSPRSTVIPKINLQMNENERWLVIGPNGGGKADFFNALSGETGLHFVPNTQGTREVPLFSNIFADSSEIVSLEKAARLIQEERENDESDYLEGGVDIGRTGRVFIATTVLLSIIPSVSLF